MLENGVFCCFSFSLQLAVVVEHSKRQIYHTTGLALCPCLRRFSITKQRIVMIKLSIAALANARKPGFSAFIFSDVKTPTGNSAAYKQAAAYDLCMWVSWRAPRTSSMANRRGKRPIALYCHNTTGALPAWVSLWTS